MAQRVGDDLHPGGELSRLPPLAMILEVGGSGADWLASKHCSLDLHCWFLNSPDLARIGSPPPPDQPATSRSASYSAPGR